MMKTAELKLTQEWDKTFPKSDKVSHSAELRTDIFCFKATPHNSRRTPCLDIIPSACPKISPHTSVCELII